MTEYLVIVLAAALVNQTVLAKCRNMRPLPEDMKASAILGLGVIAVMTKAAAVSAILDACILAPLGLSSLSVVFYLLAAGGFVWLNLWIVKNYLSDVWPQLEAYLPLIAGNCAVLGVIVNNAQSGRGFLASILAAFGTGVLLTLLNVIFDCLRARIVEEDLPEPVRGAPIVVLCAALVSLALMGLTGLSF